MADEKFEMPEGPIRIHPRDICPACACDINKPPEFSAAYLVGALDALYEGEEALLACFCDFHKGVFQQFRTMKRKGVDR